MINPKTSAYTAWEESMWQGKATSLGLTPPENRVLNGTHGPNQNMWYVEHSMRAGRTNGCYTILHHLMFENDSVAGQWGDVENEYWYGKLRFGHHAQGIPWAPERLIHIRMFHPDWTRISPEFWAEHSVAMLSSWRGAGESGGRIVDLLSDPFVTVSPANEQNLEPFPDNSVARYVAAADWNLRWANRVNELRPDRKATLCWPAFAYGHEPPGYPADGEYAIPQVQLAMAPYEILAFHPYGHLDLPEGNPHGPSGSETVYGGASYYWHLGRTLRPKGWEGPHDIGGALATCSKTKPYILSETGTFAHDQASRTDATILALDGLSLDHMRTGRCLGITTFIWNSGKEHAANRIVPNAALRQWFEHAPDYPTAAKVPPANVENQPVSQALSDMLRAEFGADFHDDSTSLPRGSVTIPRQLTEIKEFALHHTAGNETSWANIAAQHVKQWDSSIGYTFGVDSGGFHYLEPLDRVTPCVGAKNRRAACFVMQGNFDVTEPTGQQVEWMDRGMKVVRNYLNLAAKVYPHSHYKATACPGQNLRALVPFFNGEEFFGNDVFRLWADENQSIHPAPGHALPDAIFTHGLHMLSTEGRVLVEQPDRAPVRYAVLLAGDPRDTSDEWVYYTETWDGPNGTEEGNWDNIRRINRHA